MDAMDLSARFNPRRDSEEARMMRSIATVQSQYIDVPDGKLMEAVSITEGLANALNYMAMAMDGRTYSANAKRYKKVIEYHATNRNAVLLKDFVTMAAMQYGMECMEARLREIRRMEKEDVSYA